MKAVVVDTNVVAVANGKADQAGSSCILASVEALGKARENIVSIDSGGLCFNEYFRHADRSGQPGPGDQFVRWLWERQATPKHCECVDITPISGQADEFSEFPEDSELASFDRSDRKFVAIALASRYKPTILNAADTDWWNHRDALKRSGVKVEFVCPELMVDEG